MAYISIKNLESSTKIEKEAVIILIDSKEILKPIRPVYLVKHFNIIKVEELNSRLYNYFEEKNDYGNQLTAKQLISKGFYPMTTIKDFPLRGKIRKTTYSTPSLDR